MRKLSVFPNFPSVHVSNAYINDMTQRKITRLDILTARWKTAEWKTNATALAAILAGCLVVGFLTVRIPEHRAHHIARVRFVGVRHGSKAPGAKVWAELATGRNIWVKTRRYNTNLVEGARICIEEVQDKIWYTGSFLLAHPSNCAHLVLATD